ncbi:hypothetical protein GCM10009536_09600 [Streptomyces thermocarboxydus]
MDGSKTITLGPRSPPPFRRGGRLRAAGAADAVPDRPASTGAAAAAPSTARRPTAEGGVEEGTDGDVMGRLSRFRK